MGSSSHRLNRKNNNKTPSLLLCIWIVAISVFLLMSFILTPPDTTATATTTNYSKKDSSSPKFVLHQRQHTIPRHHDDKSGGVEQQPTTTIAVGEHNSNAKNKNIKAATTLVECTIITPNSLLPLEKTANGKIQITVHHHTNTNTNTNDGSNDTADNDNDADAGYYDDAMYFLQLVKLGYYDGLYFFRVIPNFVAQFGYDHIHKIDDQTKPKRRKKQQNPKPKPEGNGIKQQDEDNQDFVSLSNVRGTITLVGGNTGQVFINVGNNQRLDKEGSVPFGTIDSVGMSNVVDKIYSGYKQGSGQIQVLSRKQKSTSMDTTTVEEEMKQQFPNMSQIGTCRIIINM